MAICQQWISDGKPAVSKETIERYAEIILKPETNKSKEWYQHGTITDDNIRKVVDEFDSRKFRQ